MKTTILFSTHAADLLRGQLRDLDHEELWAIYLGSGGTLLGAEMLTCGTLTSTPIDARRLLKRALLSDATKQTDYDLIMDRRATEHRKKLHELNRNRPSERRRERGER